jgi:hypothetical protein
MTEMEARNLKVGDVIVTKYRLMADYLRVVRTNQTCSPSGVLMPTLFGKLIHVIRCDSNGRPYDDSREVWMSYHTLTDDPIHLRTKHEIEEEII